MTIFYSNEYLDPEEECVVMNSDKPSVVVLGVEAALNTYRACTHSLLLYDADLECVLPSMLSLVSDKTNWAFELAAFKSGCLEHAGEHCLAEAIVFTSAYAYLTESIAFALEKANLYTGTTLFYQTHCLQAGDIVLTTMHIPKLHDHARTTIARVLVDRASLEAQAQTCPAL